MTINKLKIFLFSFFAFPVCLSFAQKEGNIWCFGQQDKIDFNTGVPVAGVSAIPYNVEGCSTMCDRNTGQLLFYTNGMVAYTKLGFPMPNGSGLLGNQSTTQAALIVPLPNSTTKYILFALDAQAGHYSGTAGYGGLSYSMVDMTLNAGKGDIVATMKNQLLITPATEKMTAARHCNGRDIWLIVHQWKTDAFYAYLVTPAGVSATPVISHAGPPVTTVADTAVGSGYGATRGAMKASPNGKKLGLATPYDRDLVEFYDFCNGNGIVSNPVIDSSFNIINHPSGEGLYGVAFSADNSKFYVSDGRDSSQATSIYQYDMSAGSAAAIIASRQKIVSYQLNNAIGLGEIGALELAPTGKIYAAIAFSGFFTAPGHLAGINNPNVLGAGCGYTQYSVPLIVGTQSLLGLSDNFGAGKLNSTTLDTTLSCLVKGTPIILNSKNHPLPCSTFYYAWSTGDSTKSITIDSAGTYIVNQSNCYFDTINVKLNYIPVAHGSPDTTICEGTSVQLKSSGGTIYSWTPSAGLNSTTIATPIATPTVNTQYIVTVSDGFPCNDKDTINITVLRAPKANAGNDTNIIAGTPIQLHATGGGTYLWLPSNVADSVNSISPTVTTAYAVIVTAPDGCHDVDTVMVFVHPKCDGLNEIYIPSAFSPNDDGENDVFYLRQHSDCIKTFIFSVYDRWGEEVFETNNPQTGWDGTLRGQKMNTAVFVYYLHIVFVDGTVTDKKGNISLLR